MPDGVVAVLTFKVAQDMKEEVEGLLENNLSLVGPDGEKIPADAIPALVSVMQSVNPVPGCFFYMH